MNSLFSADFSDTTLWSETSRSWQFLIDVFEDMMNPLFRHSLKSIQEITQDNPKFSSSIEKSRKKLEQRRYSKTMNGCKFWSYRLWSDLPDQHDPMHHHKYSSPWWQSGDPTCFHRENHESWINQNLQKRGSTFFGFFDTKCDRCWDFSRDLRRFDTNRKKCFPFFGTSIPPPNLLLQKVKSNVLNLFIVYLIVGAIFPMLLDGYQTSIV